MTDAVRIPRHASAAAHAVTGTVWTGEQRSDGMSPPEELISVRRAARDDAVVVTVEGDVDVATADRDARRPGRNTSPRATYPNTPRRRHRQQRNTILPHQPDHQHESRAAPRPRRAAHQVSRVLSGNLGRGETSNTPPPAAGTRVPRVMRVFFPRDRNDGGPTTSKEAGPSGRARTVTRVSPTESLNYQSDQSVTTPRNLRLRGGENCRPNLVGPQGIEP
jgi:hypothetical protein